MGTNDVSNISYVNPNFKAGQIKTEILSPQTKITYTTKPDEFMKENKPQTNEKGMSTGAKVVIYGVGIAIAGIGIWKGKGIIAARKAAKKAAAEAAELAKKAAEELAKLKQSSNLSIVDFKKVGVFEKGKALIDGKGFTGTIEICKEKGTKKIYENGVLKEAFRKGERRLYESNGKIKVFDNNGALKKTFYKDSNGAKIIFPATEFGRKKFVLKPDGSVVEYYYTKRNYYDKNMLQCMIERKSKNPLKWNPNDGVKIDKKTGHKIVRMSVIGEYKPMGDGGYDIAVKKKIGGRKVTEYYDPVTRKFECRTTPLYSDAREKKPGYVLSLLENKDGSKSVDLTFSMDPNKTLAIDNNPETIRRCLSGDKEFMAKKINELKKGLKKNPSEESSVIFDE